MKKKIKKLQKGISVFLFLLLFLFTVCLTFWDLPLTFFQQDEWHAFGFILSEGKKYLTLNHSAVQLILTDRTGARLINFLLFNTFGLRSKVYGLIALFFHLLNTLLVYLVSYKIVKRKSISYLTSLFFLTNSTAHQAYTWFGTFAGSAPSLTFILFSIYSYLNFLATQKRVFKYFSLIALWFSLLFKETGVFLFIFYPLIFFLFKEKFLKRIFKEYLPFFLYGFLVILLRLKEILFPVGQTTVLITTRIGLWSILLNLLLYPFSGVSQIFIPSETLYSFSSFLTSFVFPTIPKETTEFDILSQREVGTFLSLFLSLCLMAAVVIFLKKVRQKEEKENLLKRGIIFSCLLLLLSFLPYSFLRKGEAYLEPRYYYAGSVGAAIFLPLIFYLLWQRKNNFLRVAIVGFSIIFLLVHIRIIKKDLKFQREIGLERLKILEKIEGKIPQLPQEVVFFVDGDTPGYYGLEELKVPFQSGLGQVLLTRYALKKQIDPSFFREDSSVELQDEGFLYDTLAQGYKEINGRGFGYFWDKEKLKEAVRFYQLDVEQSLYAFFYRSEKRVLEERTSLIRKETLSSF